ncbi:dephospho-CoA kinase [Microcella alkaliphila]|uniref:Dephospho-CoA kinase n=1 Tax=Microcella alkaliphila TaxID=279828 RepID=A0A0U5BN91_9MICO|nr:dephospho-CoA kinase [Microcella alkaliphila]BAU32315.1 dephospho-CoA kinase [Microcella alkaliphila]
MDVVGLTGGIAAGKSTVARRFAELGAVVIDADHLAREAVTPGSRGLAAIVERFGNAVLGDDGSLDRAALGRIVFADEGARRALNGIVHPEVRRLYAEAVADARANDPDAVIVYDVPLLAEARAADEFGTIVVVDAPADVRIARLVELRGMDREEAENRVGSQVSDADRRAMADVIIDSAGTIDETIAQTDALWRRLVAERDAR